MIELNNTENRFRVLNIIVIILSIYVLKALIAGSVKENSIPLNYIENTIFAFFFFAFSIRFFKAKNKLKFISWSWIDLLSSIAMIGFQLADRLLKLITLLRFISAFRSTKHFVNQIFNND